MPVPRCIRRFNANFAGGDDGMRSWLERTGQRYFPADSPQYDPKVNANELAIHSLARRTFMDSQSEAAQLNHPFFFNLAFKRR